MALDKINQGWKTQVNKGPHGTFVGPLRGAKLKKIDPKFWKDTTDYQPAKCAEGDHVEDEDEGDDPRTLYGPKSKWRRYVSVRIELVCVGPDIETSITKGTNTVPLRNPHRVFGGRNLWRRPVLPVPPR